MVYHGLIAETVTRRNTRGSAYVRTYVCMTDGEIESPEHNECRNTRVSYHFRLHFFCLSSFPVQHTHTHTHNTHTHTQHTHTTHTHTPHPSAYRRALFGVGGCSIENIKYINRQYDLAWSDSVEAETGIQSKKVFNALSTSKTNLCVDCSFLKNSLNGVSSVPDRYQQAVLERGGKPKKGFYSPGLIDYFISKNRNHVPRVQKKILFDSKQERISKLKQAKEASKDMPLDQRRVMKCHKDETAKVTQKMSWSSLQIDSNHANYRKLHMTWQLNQEKLESNVS